MTTFTIFINWWIGEQVETSLETKIFRFYCCISYFTCWGDRL